MTGAKVKECLSKVLFMTAAVICIIAVITIFVFIVAKSIPALSKIGVFDFIFGDVWNPNGDDVYDQAISGKYGILTMIVGSIYSTVGAVLVGGTLGFFTAVFLSRFSSKKVKKIFGTVINLLAGIPSVVYGFFGMYVMIPLFSGISPTADGSGLLVT